MFYLEHFGLTDAGKVRENNEDSLLVGSGADETLFSVADGIGGFEAGEVASRMAIDVLKDMEPGDSFEDAVTEANRRIRTAAKGDERLSGMGTTVVAVRFGGTRQRPVAEVAHVGDSRAYLLRGGRLRPVTEDHSLVAELVRSGDLTRDEAAEHPQKNLITRALGAEESVTVDTSVLPVEAGDRVMLCSDGLSDMVHEERMREVLVEHPGDPEAPARQLLAEALEAGGLDNITVVVVDVKQRRDPRRGSAGTSEMPSVGADGGSTGKAARGGAATPPDAFTRGERGGDKARGRSRSDRRRSAAGRFLAGLVRGLAALAVLAIALVPVYLWGSSRYFLDEAAGGEVVAYRGLPFTFAGVSLNEEWRRTDLTVDEVNISSRAPIRENLLYTQEDIEQVITQLKLDAEQNADQNQQPGGDGGQDGSQGGGN